MHPRHLLAGFTSFLTASVAPDRASATHPRHFGRDERVRMNVSSRAEKATSSRPRGVGRSTGWQELIRSSTQGYQSFG